MIELLNNIFSLVTGSNSINASRNERIDQINISGRDKLRRRSDLDDESIDSICEDSYHLDRSRTDEELRIHERRIKSAMNKRWVILAILLVIILPTNQISYIIFHLLHEFFHNIPVPSQIEHFKCDHTLVDDMKFLIDYWKK